MKGKVILYGWVFSLFCLLGGLGTVEWALETGEPGMLPGLALCLVFVGFSLLVIRNRKLMDEEAKRFDRWFDRTCGKINRWFGID